MRKVWLTAVLIAAGIVAGCSSNEAPPEKSSTTQTPGHGAYASCLHEHGVSPPPGPIAGPPPGTDEGTWHDATQSCASLAPGPDAG